MSVLGSGGYPRPKTSTLYTIIFLIAAAANNCAVCAALPLRRNAHLETSRLHHEDAEYRSFCSFTHRSF